MQYFGYKNLAAMAFVTAVILFVSSHYLDSQQKKTNAVLLQQIELQEVETYKLAESVKSSRLTESLTRFVSDCSLTHRNQFDSKLDKLANLSSAEIVELEPLFDACADYYANVKAGLVFQLKNEIEQLETLISIAGVSDQADVISVPISSWKGYLDLENKLAEALQEQVISQGKIISLLKEGKSVNDSEIQNLVRGARQLSELASVTTKQIDSVFLTLAP